MIKISAMKPHDKLRKIEDGPKTLALRDNPTLKTFGIEVIAIELFITLVLFFAF